MKQLTSTYEFTETSYDQSVTILLIIAHNENVFSVQSNYSQGIHTGTLYRGKESCKRAMNICFAYAKAMEKAISFAEKVLGGNTVPNDKPVNVPSVIEFEDVPFVPPMTEPQRTKVKILRVINNKNEWLIGNSYEVIAKAGIYYVLALPNGDDYWILKTDCEIVP